MDHDKLPFTFAGRVLVLVTLLLVVGGPFLYFYWLVDELPPGRYPLFLFAIPILVAGVIFFVVISGVLKILGIAVFKVQTGDNALAHDWRTPAEKLKSVLEEANVNQWKTSAPGLQRRV